MGALCTKDSRPLCMAGYLAPLTSAALPALVWLERNVRRPLKKSWPDRVFFAPAKREYTALRHHD